MSVEIGLYKVKTYSYVMGPHQGFSENVALLFCLL